MVALAGNSSESRSPSSLELTEQLSHQQDGQLANTSSSEDPDEGYEEEIHLSSSSSSKDQQESATFIDIHSQSLEQQQQQHQEHGFSFRELAKFFGPGLLTCVAYVVRFNASMLQISAGRSLGSLLIASGCAGSRQP